MNGMKLEKGDVVYIDKFDMLCYVHDVRLNKVILTYTVRYSFGGAFTHYIISSWLSMKTHQLTLISKGDFK